MMCEVFPDGSDENHEILRINGMYVSSSSDDSTGPNQDQVVLLLPPMYVSWIGALLHIASVAAVRWHPENPASYRRLPSLRQRAQIESEWRRERIARIPSLLTEFGADAWLVSAKYLPHVIAIRAKTHFQMSQREHAEDTIWWSIKNVTDFAAHRRTVVLFHTIRHLWRGNQILWYGLTTQETCGLSCAKPSKNITLNASY